VLEITSDSEDSDVGLVFKKKRKATRVPTLPTASPGGGVDSLRDSPPSATSPPPQTVQEERDEGAESAPPPLPLSEAVAASGSALPAPAPIPSLPEILIPGTVFRQFAQGFNEGMSPGNPNRGEGMPFYMGAFLAIALDWRSQAQSVTTGRQ